MPVGPTSGRSGGGAPGDAASASATAGGPGAGRRHPGLGRLPPGQGRRRAGGPSAPSAARELEVSRASGPSRRPARRSVAVRGAVGRLDGHRAVDLAAQEHADGGRLALGRARRRACRAGPGSRRRPGAHWPGVRPLLGRVVAGLGGRAGRPGPCRRRARPAWPGPAGPGPSPPRPPRRWPGRTRPGRWRRGCRRWWPPSGRSGAAAGPGAGPAAPSAGPSRPARRGSPGGVGRHMPGGCP